MGRRRQTSQTATAMLTPHLPAELLDHIVDLLHDENDPLKSCCLVSNSWIPRARKHLFARVSFHTVAHLQSWRETFRDPLASPAYYTKSLLINCPYAFAGINTEDCRWISTAVEFEVDAREVNIDEPSAIPFVLFHGFSPAVEVFAATFTSSSTSRILNLVYLFSLLKDLILVTYQPTGDDHRQPAVTQPSNPPAFTGTLGIFPEAGMEHIASQLLSLPNGLHFRELQLYRTRSFDGNDVGGEVSIYPRIPQHFLYIPRYVHSAPALMAMTHFFRRRVIVEFCDRPHESYETQIHYGCALYESPAGLPRYSELSREATSTSSGSQSTRHFSSILRNSHSRNLPTLGTR